MLRGALLMLGLILFAVAIGINLYLLTTYSAQQFLIWFVMFGISMVAAVATSVAEEL